MIVRRAGTGDESILRQLRLEALTLDPYAFGSTYERELARTTADWQSWMSPGVVFILEDEGQACGMVASAHAAADPSIVQLMAMWVRPTARGSRGADGLVTEVVAWAQTERARAVQLQVIHDNLRARRVYERHGFQATGRTTVREKDGATELQMERAVARFHDDSTKPSHPGNLRLAPRRLFPWRANSLVNRIAALVIRDDFAAKLDEHLRLGDSRAAMVVGISPLLVAAYTDELDCVVMLRFPQEFVGAFDLRAGTRLLTVNTYFKEPRIAPDLIPGPAAYDEWTNVYPVIAEFLSEDAGRIERRKCEIEESEWESCELLAREYRRLRPGVARDGSPYTAFRPAELT
jgi:ribosomal protein S18 acetylase RimI-like enzyme